MSIAAAASQKAHWDSAYLNVVHWLSKKQTFESVYRVSGKTSVEIAPKKRERLGCSFRLREPEEQWKFEARRIIDEKQASNVQEATQESPWLGAGHRLRINAGGPEKGGHLVESEEEDGES
ncbi:hypothetical protein PsorP6_002561 [Peronosclerospora sorghi]|uniref:Uncharacterized protein n=1 Tax=Peronosclerospora sorghi TaxID=230839 RepID=A0ACC0WXU5_9STRA|nr:hypothetical protein PsorP6_002561 [Peronosclerospora sorghi]